MKERGGDVRTSRPVKIVKKAGGGFDVTFAGGTETFDLVLSTVAIPELLRLAPDLPEDVRRTWGGIAYCHALCPILELDRSLSPYYWLNVGDATMVPSRMRSVATAMPVSHGMAACQGRSR